MVLAAKSAGGLLFNRMEITPGPSILSTRHPTRKPPASAEGFLIHLAPKFSHGFLRFVAVSCVLARFRTFWRGFAHFGAVSRILARFAHFGAVSRILARFRAFWRGVAHFGAVSRILARFRAFWRGFAHFGAVSHVFARFRTFSRGFASFGAVSYVFARFVLRAKFITIAIGDLEDEIETQQHFQQSRGLIFVTFNNLHHVFVAKLRLGSEGIQ